MISYVAGNPDEYLAITGRGIRTVKIAKSSIVWPFQKIEESPEDHGDALMKYAMLLADVETDKKLAVKEHLGDIIRGIIEGETRVLVSSMTMEEIFGQREQFKKAISKNIQGELSQFGLKIYNANVKELRDAPNSSYFESLSRKAHEGAINQARVDVAEAQRLGTVGEAQRQGEQKREIARIDAETAVQKTERDRSVSPPGLTSGQLQKFSWEV
ncbi:putative Flotillin-like protein 1 [Diplocarpon rosae]|nr:putative Flotillin-like protein 1 [Diplocarpon rosae]